MGFNKTIRYKEGVLEKDEQVAIYGKGKWTKASALNLPERYGNILEITAPEGENVYLSDDPKAAIYDEKKHKTNGGNGKLIHRYQK